MGHLHKNTLYMEGKEGGGCLLDGNVFLELKSVCNKISDFNIRNLILLICTGSYLQPVWQEASVMLIQLTYQFQLALYIQQPLHMLSNYGISLLGNEYNACLFFWPNCSKHRASTPNVESLSLMSTDITIQSEKIFVACRLVCCSDQKKEALYS